MKTITTLFVAVLSAALLGCAPQPVNPDGAADPATAASAPRRSICRTGDNCATVSPDVLREPQRERAGAGRSDRRSTKPN